jgi:hypothetical protein
MVKLIESELLQMDGSTFDDTEFDDGIQLLGRAPPRGTGENGEFKQPLLTLKGLIQVMKYFENQGTLD